MDVRTPQRTAMQPPLNSHMHTSMRNFYPGKGPQVGEIGWGATTMAMSPDRRFVISPDPSLQARAGFDMGRNHEYLIDRGANGGTPAN